jgi:aspartate--ammonia ligase
VGLGTSHKRRRAQSCVFEKIVNKIYSVLKRTEKTVAKKYPDIVPILPEKIKFLHSEELVAMYPSLGPRERENEAAKKFGAIFVIGIGGVLGDGKMHDNRAPDYDDWTTQTSVGKHGLNGDILLWYPLLKRAFEISSMGIRVDKDAVLKQLEIRGVSHRIELEWHKRLLNGQLPLSIGGGIGQSRLCMFFLRKLHVGEVQASVWPIDMINRCRELGICLL